MTILKCSFSLTLCSLLTLLVFGCGQVKKTHQTQDISTAKQLHVLMVEYSMENEGKFPDSMEALAKELDLSEADVSDMKPVLGNAWKFHGGNMDTDGKVILSWDQPVDGEMLVLFDNGGAQIVSKTEYSGLIE